MKSNVWFTNFPSCKLLPASIRKATNFASLGTGTCGVCINSIEELQSVPRDVKHRDLAFMWKLCISEVDPFWLWPFIIILATPIQASRSTGCSRLWCLFVTWVPLTNGETFCVPWPSNGFFEKVVNQQKHFEGHASKYDNRKSFLGFQHGHCGH